MKIINKNQMEIVGYRFIWLAVALAVMLTGAVFIIVKGFSFDTDFRGGISLQYDLHTSLDKAELDKIRAEVNAIDGITVTSIQKSGDDDSSVIIKAADAAPEVVSKVYETLNSLYGSETEVEILSESRISASISKEIKHSAIIATSIAVLLMLVYIAIRFEIRSAVAAILCLVHDIFIVVASYSIFGIPVSSNLIAVILTILGYSINATIILFDRVRQNRKLMGKTDFGVIINTSVRQTLMRSVNTTITTLFTIGMIYILGVHSIKEFALPIIVGIVAGLYSSLFLSGSFWYMLSPKRR